MNEHALAVVVFFFAFMFQKYEILNESTMEISDCDHVSAITQSITFHVLRCQWVLISERNGQTLLQKQKYSKNQTQN